jgi:hypothetical protein
MMLYDQDGQVEQILSSQRTCRCNDARPQCGVHFLPRPKALPFRSL